MLGILGHTILDIATSHKRRRIVSNATCTVSHHVYNKIIFLTRRGYQHSNTIITLNGTPLCSQILEDKNSQDPTWESNKPSAVLEDIPKVGTDGLMDNTFFYHFAVGLALPPHVRRPNSNMTLQLRGTSHPTLFSFSNHFLQG